MKCRLLLDQHADVDTISEEDRPKLKLWFVKKDTPSGVKLVPVPYFPAGTEFEHDVLGFIARGQAEPSDQEAINGCNLTPDELKKRQHAYRRISAGISPDDYTLFDNGIILGYNLDGTYKPGPNWAEYQKAAKAIPQAKDGEDI